MSAVCGVAEFAGKTGLVKMYLSVPFVTRLGVTEGSKQRQSLIASQHRSKRWRQKWFFGDMITMVSGTLPIYLMAKLKEVEK